MATSAASLKPTGIEIKEHVSYQHNASATHVYRLHRWERCSVITSFALVNEAKSLRKSGGVLLTKATSLLLFYSCAVRGVQRCLVLP